jgi:hypothetical protein
MNKFVRLIRKQFSAILGLSIVVFVALACGFQSDGDWQRELGGKKLRYVKTSGSISDEVNIWFCSDGQYAKETIFSGFSGGGGSSLSMADNDVELGNWRIENGILILQSQEGERSEYDIAKGADNSVVRLNGKGYSVTRHSECR